MESRRFEAEFPVFQENSSFTGVFLFGRNQRGPEWLISGPGDIMLLQQCIKTRLRDSGNAASLFYVPIAERNQVLQVMLFCLGIGHVAKIMNIGQGPRGTVCRGAF